MLKQQQRGLTLIEVLVGLTISLIISAGILAIFSNSLTSSQQMINNGRLNQILNATMNTIVSDIQRAGYWSNATSSTNNPFFSGTDDITTTASCITFAYDADQSGTVSDSNRFGYRLSGGTIQYRGAGGTCAGAGTWTNLTDPNIITISAFTVSTSTISLSGDGTDHTDYRTVTISMTGQLASDSDTTITLSRTIKVFNNSYSAT